MKSPVFFGLAALLTFTGAAHAAVTGNLPASPFTTWMPVVDNGALTIPHGPGPAVPAPLPHFFRTFDAPVMDQYSLNVAFKARLRNGGSPVTLANDEGVWSTGNFTMPSQVLREGDLTGSGSGQTFGFGNSLQIRNLQMAHLGRTICAANTSHISGNGKTIVLDGAFGVGAVQENLIETPSTVWRDLRPPVINQFLNAGHVDYWAQRPIPLTSGIVHKSFAFNSNDPTTFYAGLGWPFATGFAAGYHVNQPPRIGSPSIDYYANTAVFCRDSAGLSPRHIDLVDEFGVHTLVARENNPGMNANPTTTLYAPAAATFGVFHTRLMANCSRAFGTSFPMVAWQMSNMLTGGGASPSLWCQQGPANNCLAYVGQVDPHTVETFTAFHALHAVPNIDASKINSHYVFFGADLTGGFSGIYRSEIHGGVVTNFDLIATDKPGITPVQNFIGAPLQNIVSYSKFFSVNSRGTVFFRARTTAAAANDVSLITAEPGTTNHMLVVRAQKGQLFTSASYAALPAIDFQLAAPEQGTWSRGQAISNRGVAVKVILPAPRQAIFVGF